MSDIIVISIFRQLAKNPIHNEGADHYITIFFHHLRYIMVQYSLSKPPSAVTPDWIFWSQIDFQRSLASDEVSSVVFVTYKKEISVIYKPTPITDKGGLAGIMCVC